MSGIERVENLCRVVFCEIGPVAEAAVNGTFSLIRIEQTGKDQGRRTNLPARAETDRIRSGNHVPEGLASDNCRRCPPVSTDSHSPLARLPEEHDPARETVGGTVQLSQSAIDSAGMPVPLNRNFAATS